MRMHNTQINKIRLENKRMKKPFQARKSWKIALTKPYDYVYPYTSKAGLRGIFAKRNETKSAEPANQHKYINLRVSIYCPLSIWLNPRFDQEETNPLVLCFVYIFRSFGLISGRFNRNSKATKCLQRTKHRYRGLAYKLYATN
jgi:hypothetical protein